MYPKIAKDICIPVLAEVLGLKLNISFFRGARNS